MKKKAKMFIWTEEIQPFHGKLKVKVFVLPVEIRKKLGTTDTLSLGLQMYFHAIVYTIHSRLWIWLENKRRMLNLRSCESSMSLLFEAIRILHSPIAYVVSMAAVALRVAVERVEELIQAPVDLICDLANWHMPCID